MIQGQGRGITTGSSKERMINPRFELMYPFFSRKTPGIFMKFVNSMKRVTRMQKYGNILLYKEIYHYSIT